MKFIDFYKSISPQLKQVDFKRKLAAKCEVSYQSVARWIRENDVPKRHQSLIAKMLQADKNELFPVNKDDEFIFPSEKKNDDA